jgi:hypothetical protein
MYDTRSFIKDKKTPQYTEQQLSDNYDKFLNVLKKHFSGDRLQKLLFMYSEDNLGLNLSMAPAAGKVFFHNCYAGGYIDHVLNVYTASFGVKKLYEKMGGHIDFTDEEMIFAALHHDLGKLGDHNNQPYYLPNESSWHAERGEIYTFNGDIQHMNVTHRALFLLQHYNIQVTLPEYLAIFNSDGLYDECNATYLKSYGPDKELKTNLPYIIHMADFISCKTERDKWVHSEEEYVDDL